MRKTKIICTIGPACENEETLTEMCLAGMNVARLNFSHGSHEEHQKKIDLIRQVREKLELPIAIMLDTKGPGVPDQKPLQISGSPFTMGICLPLPPTMWWEIRPGFPSPIMAS